MSTEHRTGRCIVALPADDEPIHAFGEEDKHLTLVYLGKPEDNPDLDMDMVRASVQGYASDNPPFIALIDKTGELGDEGATVTFLAPDDVPQHDHLMSIPEIAAEAEKVEQFPEYLPHVTLGYNLAEDNAPNPKGTILFDRLAVWDGEDRQEFPLQKITSLPVTDVFSLKRSIGLADKLSAGPARDAARRVLTRRARELSCLYAVPTQWIRDRQASTRIRSDALDNYKAKTIAFDDSVVFAAKSAASGLPDTVLRTAYMRAVRAFAMISPASRPPISRDLFAQARVNSLIRLAQGDLSARSDDMDLLVRMKESS